MHPRALFDSRSALYVPTRKELHCCTVVQGVRATSPHVFNENNKRFWAKICIPAKINYRFRVIFGCPAFFERVHEPCKATIFCPEQRSSYGPFYYNWKQAQTGVSLTPCRTRMEVSTNRRRLFPLTGWGRRLADWRWVLSTPRSSVK